LSTTTSAAYNFNVAPLVGMSLRGVLFFSEIARASVGGADFVNLVSSWREAWGRPEMPFLLLSPSQPQANSVRVEEALAKASELPRVRVIPPNTNVDAMGTNAALWREVASAAKEIPAVSGTDFSAVRKWSPAALVEVPGEKVPLEAACIFGDHMVVQAGMPVPVWGWAKPGATIHVSFAGQTVEGAADRAGEWRVVLAPMDKSGTPLEMRITSKRGAEVEELRFGNALIGEVWANSGQSNAGRVLAATLGFEQEKPKCNFADIRYLRVSGGDSAFPARRARGTWVVLTPESAGMMPGQGYYFSKQIHQQLDTPVGLVNSSAGGSTIFSWVSEEALGFSPKLKPLLADFRKHRDARVERLPVLKELVRRWVQETRRNGTAARPMPFYPIDGLLLNPIEARGCLLYHSMLHPIIGLTMRGMLWNQGEADTGAGVRSDTYTELMEGMVADWRKSWGYDFPFFFVQMPAVKARPGLPQMWEAQTRAMNRIPNSGMIVCNDISDGDVHPADKKNVGERLARLALVRTYGVKGVLDSSPFWKKAEREGHRVVVTFSPVGEGLQTRDGKSPDAWEIAGADGKFVAATAVISGDRVVVSAPGVHAPEHVRLGWNGESNCNLVNSAGLPAMPFSTTVGP
jgi:sialate O-acetylesterase